MLLAVLILSIFASDFAVALSTQAPLTQAVSNRSDLARWGLDVLPNPDATDHLVFETVSSLLQHWPNARMRNGHTIVPGILPKGTLLYHGAAQRELPRGPEWVAMDPEQAYFFCWDWDFSISIRRQGCWYLTLATTRPLKIVYFDGSSAAKLANGSLDAQDLLLWGRSDPADVFNESARIDGLCGWVKRFGLDGIVRMGTDFEIMLCDFTSGVHVVSFANIESSPETSVPSMLKGSALYEVMNANSRHNRFLGETRVHLDLAGLVSFYDTQLVPSLVASRVGQERWDHRLVDISSEDLSAVKSRVEMTWTRPSGSSGVDWGTLVHVIVDQFAGRLELIRHLLNSSTTNPSEVLDLANKTQVQLRVILMPHILLSARPTELLDEGDLDWTVPIYKLCATTQTSFVESELGSMTNSEMLILQSVRGTSREICRVVTKMWAAGVYAGIDALLNTGASPDNAKVTRIWGLWKEDLNRLMMWLDWSVWIKCDPACDPEELCYLPTWPVGFPVPEWWYPGYGRQAAGPLADGREWVRPRPRCIRGL